MLSLALGRSNSHRSDGILYAKSVKFGTSIFFCSSSFSLESAWQNLEVPLLVGSNVNFPLWHSKVKELKLTLSRQVKFNIQSDDEAVKIGRKAAPGCDVQANYVYFCLAI